MNSEFRIKKGKDIRERALGFALDVIHTANNFPKKATGFVINKQLIRSATSIGANLTEGSAAVSKKDLINFLNIARKSSFETQFWLQLSLRAQLALEKKLVPLIKECDEIKKILTTIILNVKKKKKK